MSIDKEQAMKTRRLSPVILLMTLGLLMLATLVSLRPASLEAQGVPPPIPALYSGAVLVGGETPPDGLTITARILDYESQPSTITDGRYELLIVGPPDGSFIGETITFLLENLQADQTDIYIPGSVDLSFDLTFPALAVPCALGLTLGYDGSTLAMNFELRTASPAIWSVWLVFRTQAIPLWSLPIPAISPLASFTVPVPFPSVGTVGFLTSLTTQDGAACYAFDTIDTGAPSSSAPSAEELRSLFSNAKTFN
ncbi:MAG: hypothetical protein IIB15_07055 [Chloroflexi bacterium]|nr:hypothetical protein [Chloroflexota bacterium]